MSATANDSPAPSAAARLRAHVRAGIDELRFRPRGQMPVLDALRSLAVLMVVSDHTMSWWQYAGGRQLGIGKLPLIYFGWTGVDLFFILSGYLIGRQLWREYAETGAVRVGRFVLRRGFRIWPLYVAFAIGTPLLTAAPVRLSDWLFYSNYAGGSVMGGWSLSTEEQFYLLLPTAVALGARVLGVRGWTVALPILLGMVEVARLVTANALVARGLDAQAVKLAMYEPGHLRCEGLLVGAFIALIHVRFPGVLAPVRTARGVLGAVGVGAAGVVVAGALRTVSPVVLPYLGLASVYGGLAVMLLLLREAAFIRHIGLNSKALYRVSRLSYGVYLNHFFVIKWMLAVGTPFVFASVGNNHAGFLLSLGMGIALSVAVACLTFVLIEHPFLALRSAVLSSRPAGGGAADASQQAPRRTQHPALSPAAHQAGAGAMPASVPPQAL